MMLSCIAIIFAVVFLVVGVATVYKGKATQTFTFAVSVLVAFVPEGLPSTVTLLCVLSSRPSQCASLNAFRLSIAAKRMAAQNVLVKDLQGVETLGVFLMFSSRTSSLMIIFQARWVDRCVLSPRPGSFFVQLTLLATDKTGTLTRNQMTVQTHTLPVPNRVSRAYIR
jgi:sodium/potassium-transporting ATPase subunit alpha